MSAAVTAGVVMAAGVGLAIIVLTVAHPGKPDTRGLPAVPGLTGVVNRGGVAWYEVPPPAWRHRCYAQSGAWTRRTRSEAPLWIETCPCGALRADDGRWEQRNSRRRDQGQHRGLGALLHCGRST